ncbi:MAG TPA: STM4012 family radical SAM protein [Gemmata sp.]
MPLTEQHPILTASAYQGYVYAYPHKTAYRPFAPRALRDVWAGEPQGNLFLYVHVPFCTMRCGFCNLFTTANPKRDLVTLYLDALDRQTGAVREALPGATFARFAIGGGTPTYLNEAELGHVFDLAQKVLGADPHAIPTGIEASPDTLTPEKVALLKARGVERVSIGVQSFIESEAANSGRPQSRADVDSALSLLKGANFGTLNLDLIYGLPGQTVGTWLYSLRAALQYAPEELYLYPLYVRPLTGLGRSHKEWDDTRLACYREARALLLSVGYEQVSMRMFRRGPSRVGPAYCCQVDGMIGLGCGARSYTRGLHYSLDYAVQPKSVKAIIADYLSYTRADFAHARHGFALDRDEQRRRYVLQSVLNADGLRAADYRARFGSDPAADFPELPAFAESGLLVFDGARWAPTALGLERSDALGPWFFSDRVRALMAEYDLK